MLQSSIHSSWTDAKGSIAAEVHENEGPWLLKVQQHWGTGLAAL